MAKKRKHACDPKPDNPGNDPSAASQQPEQALTGFKETPIDNEARAEVGPVFRSEEKVPVACSPRIADRHRNLMLRDGSPLPHCKQGIKAESKESKEITSTAYEEASLLLRMRLCDPLFVHSYSKDSPQSNYSKLKFIISSSITECCNNSVLLLGPNGCGKVAVLELVLEDLKVEYPDLITVVRLNGLFHGNDNHGLKEIARQLCLEHHLPFSKMASSDDNSEFLTDMLRECGLAHKTIIFILEEFDLFTQGKQRVLYSLLDALQSWTSQAAFIGVSCRLDADQLLEKRVRSRFSHRKILFLPPSLEDVGRLVKCLLCLPEDSMSSSKYVMEFNSHICNILSTKEFKEILNVVMDADNSTNKLVQFLYRAVCDMSLKCGFLSLENFKTASLSVHRQPKMEYLRNSSILELYLLVCMNRLNIKEQNSYNFNSIMKEYNAIHDAYKTSDFHSRDVCLRAFDHLLDRRLTGFTDSYSRSQSIEFRPVKLLVSSYELHECLKSYPSCPVILIKLLDGEQFK